MLARMKVLRLATQMDTQPITRPGLDTQEPVDWQGFTMPEIAPVETPGAPAMQQMQHAIDSVLREATSLGLSLYGTHALILAALGSAAPTFTLDDLRELVLAHARA
jgi:hypothetical protein